MIKSNPSHTVWISHRGYYKHCVENTLLAFDEAINAGFSMLETDLRCSKDNHLVLCHDPDLKRLGIPNKQISEMTRKEIEAIELRYYSKVMFFEEFCERYSAYNWILDIKPESGFKTIEQLLLLTKKNSSFLHIIYEQCWFLFWNKKQESIFLKYFPKATILPNEKACWRAGLSLYFGMSFLGNIQRDKIYAIPPRFAGKYFYKKSVVDIFHKKGAKLLAYLPEQNKDLENAKKAGFDFILCNEKPLIPKKFFTPSFKKRDSKNQDFSKTKYKKNRS